MTVLPLLAFVIPIVRRQPHNAQQQELQHARPRAHHHRRYRSPLPPPLQAKLRVCTVEDCVQQGAYQTLARLKKEARGEEIQVPSWRFVDSTILLVYTCMTLTKLLLCCKFIRRHFGMSISLAHARNHTGRNFRCFPRPRNREAHLVRQQPQFQR